MRKIKAIVYGVGAMGRVMTKFMVEKGVDIVGAIGTGVALSIYNPLTCAVHIPSIFNAIGMTIPSILAGGLAYYILARIFLIPKRIGFPEMPLPNR